MPLTPEEAKKLAVEILDEPDAGSPPSPAPRAASRPLPERIGNYRILGVIAAGGMGVVYEAEQDQPRRSVALKVMKRGIASPKALQRFKYEAEILGRLRHPAIAQIYEAGTHDDGSGGVPFFAMEYLPSAKPITQYADTTNLTTRDRLELFAQVCDGVHHGHQKGVIHRDLKPANILVDETGQPKIIDFGVARATDSDITLTTMHADVRQLVGTLQYMSPEQCDGDPHEIDVRSDVYSLGVLLYELELLCGRLPYDLSETPIPHATRLIQERDPPRPGTILKSLRGDIEAILLKALEKDPKRRYQSAADLARDIRRHLGREPIEARAPGLWTLTMRRVGQHPIMATTAACLLLAGLTFAATWLLVWYYSFRPDHVHLADDRREAQLISAGGAILHTWRSQDQGVITFADLVARPGELGGGKLALLCFSADPGALQGSLCAFDVSESCDTPLWTAQITDEDIRKAPLRTDSTERQFGVSWADLLDVFPESPGPEIVTIHGHAIYSPRVVRIYDLNGHLQYQAWHDGGLSTARWLPAAGLLVLAGVNNERTWLERGVPAVEGLPIVLFALRMSKGYQGSGFVSSSAGENPPDLVWYKCLLPPATSGLYEGFLLSAPLPGDDSSRHFRVGLRLRDSEDADFTFLVDETGQADPGTYIVSDAYKALQQAGKAPDPTLTYLGEMP